MQTLETGVNIKKGEIFFITSGAYSDTDYHLFKALENINDEALQPLFNHCLTHEFDCDWRNDIEPINFIIMLEHARIIEHLPISKTISFNYSLRIFVTLIKIIAGKITVKNKNRFTN